MESNGKRVTTSGEPLDYFVGEVDFGEPGTTGQHSFFQLMHMGQVALALPLPPTLTPNSNPNPHPPTPTPTPTPTLAPTLALTPTPTLLTWGRWSPPTS